MGKVYRRASSLLSRRCLRWPHVHSLELDSELQSPDPAIISAPTDRCASESVLDFDDFSYAAVLSGPWRADHSNLACGLRCCRLALTNRSLPFLLSSLFRVSLLCARPICHRHRLSFLPSTQPTMRAQQESPGKPSYGVGSERERSRNRKKALWANSRAQGSLSKRRRRPHSST